MIKHKKKNYLRISKSTDNSNQINYKNNLLFKYNMKVEKNQYGGLECVKVLYFTNLFMRVLKN